MYTNVGRLAEAAESMGKRVRRYHRTHQIDGAAAIAQAVAFPTTRQLLEGYGREFPAPTLLLTLIDGTVWIFKSVGNAWTERRIGKVAALALAVSHEDIDIVGLQNLFSTSLDMPALKIIHTIPACELPEELASGNKEYEECRRKETSSVEVDAGASKLYREDAFKKVILSLDSAVLRHAYDGTKLDIRIYNYLIHKTHGHYRRQFAKSFPLLLPDIVKSSPRCDDGILIRRAIDFGVPIVRELACVWSVAPRVVRCLVGMTLSMVGERWSGNSRNLARLLDALPKEFLPGSDPRQWSQFNRAVEVAHNLLHEECWNSVATLAWLRECSSWWREQSEGSNATVGQGRKLVESISRLQKSLQSTLILEVEDRITILPANIVDRVKQVVDDIMVSSLKKGWLPQMAARFNREMGNSTMEEDLVTRFLTGKTIWPLLSSAYTSSDGSRRVVALTDEADFHIQARKLKICVSRPSYIERCRSGKSFVLAILDTKAGEPQSTAEVRIIQRDSDRDWSLAVAQHTGAENSPVSEECSRAIFEVLTCCNNLESRRHINQGLQLISEVDRNGIVWAHRQALILQSAPVVRAAIGDSTYDAAIRRVCASVE
jgi:hypothetical protein